LFAHKILQTLAYVSRHLKFFEDATNAANREFCRS